MADNQINKKVPEESDSDKKGVLTGYLIMNADDYGPLDYINDGIIKGIEDGIVNSVSVLVSYQDMPEYPNFIHNLNRLMKTVEKVDHHVGIGLHLSLNAGKPITSKKEEIDALMSKRKEGYFKSVNEININKNYINAAKVEIKNQIEFLSDYLKSHDREIDHINHHVGFVSFHQGLWECFIEIAQQENLPVRSPVGYMSIASLFYINGLFSGATTEGIKKTAEKWLSNLLNLSPHRNITDSPFKMLFARKKMMNDKYEYARTKGVGMPKVYNDNYYDEASTKKAINFLRSFKDGEIREFMLHPSLDKSSDGISPPHGFKKRSLRKRHRELKILLDSFYKKDRNTRIKLTEVIKGESNIFNLKKKEIKLELINYKDIARIRASK